MNISLFSDWIEDRLFGEGPLAHVVADIVDEAMARDTPGEFNPSERVAEGQLQSAWNAAQDEDSTIRARTAVLLGRLGFDKAEDGLDEARRGGDTSLSRAAAIVLARTRGIDEELLETLDQTVEDPAESRELRSAAARAIAKENTLATTATLARIAQSDDPDLAQYGLEGLGMVRPEPASAERETALEAMLGALRSKEATLKIAAAEALGNFGDARAIKELEMVLIEKDPAIRRRALFALANLGADSAKGPLTRMLRDFSIPARWEICDLLGEHYGESMVDALALAVQDRDPEIRDHVVAALAKMTGPASLELLRKIVADDEDSFVREQALAAVSEREAQQAERPAATAPTREPEPAAAAAGPRVGTPPPPPAESGPVPAPVAAPRTPPKPPGLSKLQPLYATGQPSAAPPPEHKELTNLIERALESMECTWWLEPQGYQVQVPLANAKEKVTILLGEVDYEESPVYRFLVHCGPAEPGAYEAALRNNRYVDYGSLGIADVAGRPSFVLTHAMLASAATVPGVRKVLGSLAQTASHLRG